MYSGNGAGDGSVPGSELTLSEDVVFEDPAAVCVGRAEVVEAFRAIKEFRPKNIGHARGRSADPRTLDYDISTEYSPQIFGGTFTYELRSRIMVTLDERRHVVRIEERWNHIPFVDGLRPFRRINGIVFYYLTSFLVK